jgi:hypothetical protein
MNPFKVSVASIVETIDGYSRVIIDTPTFKMIGATLNAKNFNNREENKALPRKVAPLNFSTAGDEGGNGVYAFQFENATVYANIHKTGEKGINPKTQAEFNVVKTVFMMEENEAKECLIPNTVAFNISKFNLEAVKTA